MRAVQALEVVTAKVREVFDADVAEAIVGDEEMFGVAARFLGRETGTQEDAAAVVAEVAGAVDDGLADWLVEVAESPGGWFYSQVTKRI
jgi:hypothetical protein